MASFLAIATSFLIMLSSDIWPSVCHSVGLQNNSIASFQCVDCCNEIARQSANLSDFISRQDKQIEDLVQIKAKVVDDLPLKLEQLSKDSQSLKKAVTDDILPKIERQSSSLKGIEASVASVVENMEKLSSNLQTLEDRLKEQYQIFKALSPAFKEIHDSLVGPKDCSDIRTLGHSVSGIYRVYPGSLAKRIQADVYCDLTSPSINWLVFQRRKDGSQNFEQTWSDYAAGFGNVNGEYWLGNELLYMLTSNRKYKLRIELEDFDGQKRYAEYAAFSISSAANRYRLTVAGYTGDAGDSFSGHSGMQFSTKDVDNDILNEGSCSQLFRGGWWYSSCHSSNLNGLYLRGNHTSYADGIEWYSFRGYYHSLNTTEMKITALN